MTQEQYKQTTFNKYYPQNNVLTERLEYISRIFEYDKYLGQDLKELKFNKYYWNDLFDSLYDLDIDELMQMEITMFNIIEDYKRCINERSYFERE
jgi:hypothetical protein